MSRNQQWSTFVLNLDFSDVQFCTELFSDLLTPDLDNKLRCWKVTGNKPTFSTCPSWPIGLGNSGYPCSGQFHPQELYKQAERKCQPSYYHKSWLLYWMDTWKIWRLTYLGGIFEWPYMPLISNILLARADGIRVCYPSFLLGTVWRHKFQLSTLKLYFWKVLTNRANAGCKLFCHWKYFIIYIPAKNVLPQNVQSFLNSLGLPAGFIWMYSITNSILFIIIIILNYKILKKKNTRGSYKCRFIPGFCSSGLSSWGSGFFWNCFWLSFGCSMCLGLDPARTVVDCLGRLESRSWRGMSFTGTISSWA